MISLLNVGFAATKLGDLASGRRYLREAVALAGEFGAVYAGVGAVENVACLAIAARDPEPAARLLAGSIGFKQARGLAATPAEQRELDAQLAAVRSALGESRLAAIMESGKTVPLDVLLRQAAQWLDAT